MRFQAIRFMGAALAAVGGLLLIASWAWSQQGWPNEVYYARCIPQQSCYDDCVIKWEPKPSCPSGTGCVAFNTVFGQNTQFKACVASTVSTDKCNTGDVQPPPPVVATCWGLIYGCACRSTTSGECENNIPPLAGPCLCQGDAIGSGTYLANNNCT